jgi:hypothetical protein
MDNFVPPSMTQEPTRRRGPTLAAAVAVAITIAGWILSFASQVQLAMIPAHHFPWPEPILFGCTTELVALGCMALARERAQRGDDPREVFALTALASAVILGANILIGWPDIVGVFMHSYTCLIAPWVWKLCLFPRGIRHLDAHDARSGNAPPDAPMRVEGEAGTRNPGALAPAARALLEPHIETLMTRGRQRAALIRSVHIDTGLDKTSVRKVAAEIVRNAQLNAQRA